jgi:flagellar assembly factor FliW
MRVETARFGPLEVEPDALFHFPAGMLGFAHHKQFVVLDHGEDSPFKWLQSVEDHELAFVMTDPLYFKRDYHIAVRKGELTVIEPDNEDDLVVSVIMTIPAQQPQEMSANLLAPLIFNMGNRKGMQYVLTDHRFPVKYFVLKEQEAAKARPADPAPTAPLRSISLR